MYLMPYRLRKDSAKRARANSIKTRIKKSLEIPIKTHVNPIQDPIIPMASVKASKKPIQQVKK